jgi:hypothetical protein
LARVPKPAAALLVGLVLIIVSACGSSAATAGPGGAGAAAGGAGATSAAAGGAGATSAAAASAKATVNSNDASSIITGVINGGADIKSFHIKLAVSGTIKAAALQSTAGSAGAAITQDLVLDGTSLEGDVDVANSAAHLAFNVPPVAALGNMPLSGDLILVDNALYYKVSLLGPKYTKTDLGSLTSLSPVAVPTPGASGMASVTDEITKLRAAMDAAGVKATLVGVDQVGGKDAYHITITGLSDYLNAQIAAQASAATTMTIDSASVDFWVYKDSSRFAQLEIKGASSSFGNIDLTLTVTNYDQPVTIAAPAASDIGTGTASALP